MGERAGGRAPAVEVDDAVLEGADAHAHRGEHLIAPRSAPRLILRSPAPTPLLRTHPPNPPHPPPHARARTCPEASAKGGWTRAVMEASVGLRATAAANPVLGSAENVSMNAICPRPARAVSLPARGARGARGRAGRGARGARGAGRGARGAGRGARGAGRGARGAGRGARGAPRRGRRRGRRRCGPASPGRHPRPATPAARGGTPGAGGA